MGCFPLIPAYYTAVCLEDAARAVFSASMLIGIILFVPITAAVKYFMALAVILLNSRAFIRSNPVLSRFEVFQPFEILKKHLRYIKKDLRTGRI